MTERDTSHNLKKKISQILRVYITPRVNFSSNKFGETMSRPEDYLRTIAVLFTNLERANRNLIEANLKPLYEPEEVSLFNRLLSMVSTLSAELTDSKVTEDTLEDTFKKWEQIGFTSYIDVNRNPSKDQEIISVLKGFPVDEILATNNGAFTYFCQCLAARAPALVGALCAPDNGFIMHPQQHYASLRTKTHALLFH